MTEVCPSSGRIKLWAQQVVDADLMTEELERMGVHKEHTQVTVLDSGFDFTRRSSQMADSDLNGLDSGWQFTDVRSDRVGHGTGVSALIGGAAGIGVAPSARLSVASMNPVGHSLRDETVQARLAQACLRGAEVINYSGGHVIEEMGHGLDVRNPKFVTALANHGCLLVKASGNDAYRRVPGPRDPDDALLIVGATTSDGELAEFSSPSEILAPGQGVFTLDSLDVPQGERAQGRNRCGAQPGNFVSGTSFAAPIVTGIASGVMGVLKLSPKYALLKPRERIRLVNRILRASALSSGGMVNGLRAVLIAKKWNESWSEEIPAESDLRREFDQAVKFDCQKRFYVNCMESGGCSNIQKCFKSRRRHLSVCGGAFDEPAIELVLKDMLSVAHHADHLELATHWIKQWSKARPNKALSIPAVEARDAWTHFVREDATWTELYSLDLVRKASYAAAYARASGRVIPDNLQALRDLAFRQIAISENLGYRVTLLSVLQREGLVDSNLLKAWLDHYRDDHETTWTIVRGIAESASPLADSDSVIRHLIGRAGERPGQAFAILRESKGNGEEIPGLANLLREWIRHPGMHDDGFKYLMEVIAFRKNDQGIKAEGLSLLLEAVSAPNAHANTWGSLFHLFKFQYLPADWRWAVLEHMVSFRNKNGDNLVVVAFDLMNGEEKNPRADRLAHRALTSPQTRGHVVLALAISAGQNPLAFYDLPAVVKEMLDSPFANSEALHPLLSLFGNDFYPAQLKLKIADLLLASGKLSDWQVALMARMGYQR